MMFSKWLAELHAKGEIDTEMTDELRDLVSAVLACQALAGPAPAEVATPPVSTVLAG